MPDYKIVPYRSELKEQVAELYGKAFKLGPTEASDYLSWKYEQNPYINEPLLFVALDCRGAVVGMRGFYGSCWNVAGRPTVIPCADDFAIAPGERNQGLATQLMRTATDSLSTQGYEHVLNASGGVVTVLQSLAMGWRSLGAMEPVARVNSLERARRVAEGTMGSRLGIRLLMNKTFRNDSSCFDRLDKARQCSSSAGAGVVITTTPRAEAMATVVRGHRNNGRVAHSRDIAFLRWRFENPSRDYRFFYHERDGALAGFLIIARYRQLRYQGLPCSIVDLEGRDRQTQSDLLESALTMGRFSAIGAWSASFSTDGRKMLTDVGFAPSEPERRARGMPCVLIKRLKPAPLHSAALESASWDIRLIDSMHG